MGRLHWQSGWFSLVVVLAVVGQVPNLASADTLLSEIDVIDSSEAWSPGPVHGSVEPGTAWEDEAYNEFLWAGDQHLGLLMSFDPDDEEVFLGWQAEF